MRLRHVIAFALVAGSLIALSACEDRPEDAGELKDVEVAFDGVFAPCEPVTVAWAQKLGGKIKLVGFDASHQSIKAFNEGRVHALVLQNPVKMGYLGVMKMHEHLSGKEVEQRIDTGVVVVTPENKDEHQELLNPPLKDYGDYADERVDVPGKLIKIAVIPKGTTHEFWKSIFAGAKQAEQELREKGVNVEIIWKGPAKEDDRDDQIQVVENFVASGVDGIVLAPLDDTALRGPVQDATAKGIPVVIIDSDLNATAGKDYVTFVATDNYRGGQLGGEHLAKLLEGKGKVVLLRYQQGSASTNAREKGFLDAMNAAEGVEVISDNQYSGATTPSALQAVENLIQRFKVQE